MCQIVTKKAAILKGLKALKFDKRSALDCCERQKLNDWLRAKYENWCVTDVHILIVVRENYRNFIKQTVVDALNDAGVDMDFFWNRVTASDVYGQHGAEITIRVCSLE